MLKDSTLILFVTKQDLQIRVCRDGVVCEGVGAGAIPVLYRLQECSRSL